LHKQLDCTFSRTHGQVIDAVIMTHVLLAHRRESFQKPSFCIRHFSRAPATR